ncbi:hypothetical protein HUG17_4260 [Dermatophagoides farinae]|uniref:Glypican-5-like n=1 Tax=Dermatophagoides farinae TaxID=6954 RepID=A0A9D4NY64_DERFA|nr:hypothetical protein HUG17_4260 [Dermatophagoides farinae]
MKISTFENHFIQYYNRIYWKLDQILNDTITDIDEYFGRTKTNQQQDHRIVKANRNLIEFIRMVIFESRHHTPIQLNDHVDHLLEAIFIDILQQPHQNKFPNEYESCLLDTMKDSDILSKTRDEMLFRFSRTIDTASLIVHSLQNSLQLINQTIEIKTINKPDCIQRLSRTFHCYHCTATTTATNWPSIMTATSCSSSCYETINNCLDQTNMERLDSTMKTLYRSYQQLVNLMVNYFNPEILMSSHRRSIEQAQEWIRSKNDKIAKNARIACGSLKRYFRSAAGIIISANTNNGNTGENAYDFYNYSTTTTTTSPNDDLTDDDNTGSNVHGFSLYVSIQSMAHLFAKHKDMFADLDGKMCAQYNNNDQNCWNGTNMVSSYQARQQDRQQHQSLSMNSGHHRNHNQNVSDNDMIITLHDRVKKSETTIKELLIHNQRSSKFININQVITTTTTTNTKHQYSDSSAKRFAMPANSLLFGSILLTTISSYYLLLFTTS